jgi:hypothetical protein
MAFLIEYHWGWLAGAAGLGFVMGWIGTVHRLGGVSRKALSWLTVVMAVAVALSVVRIIPGRFGYWLDLGLVMFAIYIVGCTVGSWLRGLLISHQPTS